MHVRVPDGCSCRKSCKWQRASSIPFRNNFLYLKVFCDFDKSYVQLHNGSFYHPFGHKYENFFNSFVKKFFTKDQFFIIFKIKILKLFNWALETLDTDGLKNSKNYNFRLIKDPYIKFRLATFWATQPVLYHYWKLLNLQEKFKKMYI